MLVSKASVRPLREAVSGVMDLIEFCRVEVRVTIGSTDDAVLGFWEPGAPKFTERIAALKWAHDNGFQTSVSVEPMLDSLPGCVIAAVTPYVSPDRGIWLGRANRLMQTVAVNCPGDARVKAAASALEAWWNDAAITRLYWEWKDNPLIRWKDSVRQVVEKKGKQEFQISN